MSILDWTPLSRIRRNHALEHATLQVLAKTGRPYRLAGYSDLHGFWVFGEVATEALGAAVEEALARLQNSESGLAIHPHCGTNYAVPGLLAGTAAWLAMLGANDSRKQLERWPLLVLLVTLVLILSRPLGPLLQARVTTDGRPAGLRVRAVLRQSDARPTLHRVLTQG